MIKRKYSNSEKKPQRRTKQTAKAPCVPKYPFDLTSQEVYEPTPEELRLYWIVWKTWAKEGRADAADLAEWKRYLVRDCGHKLEDVEAFTFYDALKVSQRALGRNLAESLLSRKRRKRLGLARGRENTETQAAMQNMTKRDQQSNVEYSLPLGNKKWAEIFGVSPNKMREIRLSGQYHFVPVSARKWKLPKKELPTEYLEKYRQQPKFQRSRAL